MRTLVIGVGNLLRTDDGVGIHVINSLNKLNSEIDTLDAAMGSVEIIEALRGYDRAIIVDAIETGAEPGTIYRVNLTGGEKPPVVTHSHGTDLITTLQLGRQLFPDEMPTEIILIAVEAEDTTTISDKPTQKVQSAIKKVLKIIVDNIAEERR
jgi:hydrogenase maturation protease